MNYVDDFIVFLCTNLIKAGMFLSMCLIYVQGVIGIVLFLAGISLAAKLIF